MRALVIVPVIPTLSVGTLAKKWLCRDTGSAVATIRQRQPCRSDSDSDLRSPECEVLSKCELRPQSTNGLAQRCTLGELSCGAMAKKRSGRIPRDVALSVKELEPGGYFDMRVEARAPALFLAQLHVRCRVVGALFSSNPATGN